MSLETWPKERVAVLVEMFQAGPNQPDEARLRKYLKHTASFPVEVLVAACDDAVEMTQGPYAPGIGDLCRCARRRMAAWREQLEHQHYDREAERIHRGTQSVLEIEKALDALVKAHPAGVFGVWPNRLEDLYRKTLRDAELEG